MSVTLDRVVFDQHWADLFAWRNDPDTIKHSLSSKPVTVDEHVKWLKTALANTDIAIYVARDPGQGWKVGMGRLERRDATTTEISVNMNPRWRGRGYGKKTINALVAACHGTTVLAVIKETNPVSLQTFTSCGFTIQKIGQGKRAGIVELVFTK